jgi:hypothetical protein
MGRKAYNGRALALAELTRRAAYIVALGGRTYDDSACSVKQFRTLSRNILLGINPK